MKIKNMPQKNIPLLLLALVFIIVTVFLYFFRNAEPTYTTISSEEAKKMMEQNSNVIILDVRTQKEFDLGHIPGSILIPHDEILAKASDILTDKNAVILVYCRSGRRSALAAADLASMGYKHVYDFGGIINWRYAIVS